jgi:hypothetical protein
VISRSKQTKQMLPGRGSKPKPKKPGGGKLPAAFGKPKTNHGAMKFARGGKVKGC